MPLHLDKYKNTRVLISTKKKFNQRPIDAVVTTRQSTMNKTNTIGSTHQIDSTINTLPTTLRIQIIDLRVIPATERYYKVK